MDRKNTLMEPLRLHILYEYGENLRPHASASLRLICPLTHPALIGRVEITFGRKLGENPVDIVLVDRLWRPDIEAVMVDELAKEVRQRGAKLVYWFDDNFLLLRDHDTRTTRYRESFQRFLELCDGAIVSSAELKTTFEQKKPVVYLPSALDERLIVQKRARGTGKNRICIGYMGTSTHDEDLRLVLPALQAVFKKYPRRIRLQMIGVLSQSALEQIEELHHLPIEIVSPSPVESEYQAFLVWFTGEVRWDIGIAPLVDNEFNRYKSDIKFLDYSAAAVPGIYSKSPAYAGTVRDSYNGLLVENTSEAWTMALERLVEDERLRLDIIDNASRYLYSERILARCAEKWLVAIREALGG